MNTATDRIEKQVTLKAPVSRVWRAITDAQEFGAWFGVKLDGPFVAGATLRGDFDGEIPEDVIRAEEDRLGLAHAPIRTPAKDEVFCVVERIEPERYFSFRWVPYGIDADVDPATEPMTLVEFRLAPHPEGTHLTIVESGFDRVPAQRRRRAFLMNDGGWAAQAENLRAYLERA